MTDAQTATQQINPGSIVRHTISGKFASVCEITPSHLFVHLLDGTPSIWAIRNVVLIDSVSL